MPDYFNLLLTFCVLLRKNTHILPYSPWSTTSVTNSSQVYLPCSSLIHLFPSLISLQLNQHRSTNTFSCPFISSLTSQLIQNDFIPISHTKPQQLIKAYLKHHHFHKEILIFLAMKIPHFSEHPSYLSSLSLFMYFFLY